MYSPTVLVYGVNKGQPFEYEGRYEASPLSKWVKNVVDGENYYPQPADYNGGEAH